MDDHKITRRQLAAAKAREGIPVSLIVRKLARCVSGKEDMSPTQLRASEILLKKAMPDLSAVEHSGDVTHRQASELSREELMRIAASGSAGVVEAGRGDGEPAAVH